LLESAAKAQNERGKSVNLENSNSRKKIYICQCSSY
jgi:hypothetical protein